MHQAETQRLAAAAPPNADDMKRAMAAIPDPAPFVRAEDDETPGSGMSPELTTGSVVRVTSPTFAAQMAGSTLVMVALIVLLALIGIAMIVLAVRL